MRESVVPKRTNPKIYDGGLQWKDSAPRFIGIDQSYGGFAVTSIIADGRFHTEVYEGQGKGVDRLYDIQKFLGRYFEYSENVKNVAMEGYAYGSQMAHMAGELGGLVKLELRHWFPEENAKYPLIVVPSQVKKYVTGKGMGVKKNQILMHVYKKWGVEFDDDNAADSYALARIAAGMQDLAYEKDILKKLLDPKYREKPVP